MWQNIKSVAKPTMVFGAVAGAGVMAFLAATMLIPTMVLGGLTGFLTAAAAIGVCTVGGGLIGGTGGAVLGAGLAVAVLALRGMFHRKPAEPEFPPADSPDVKVGRSAGVSAENTPGIGSPPKTPGMDTTRQWTR